MLTAAILLMALSAEPSVNTEESKPTASHQTDWEFFVALSGGFQPDVHAAVGTGRIGLNRKVNRYFRPELNLFSGADNGPITNQFFTGIRLGTRIELPREGAVPYL